jgi:hypothetical protein
VFSLAAFYQLYTVMFKVEVYKPNGSRGVPTSDTPPEAPQNAIIKRYDFNKLPPTYIKKYQYASRYVSFVFKYWLVTKFFTKILFSYEIKYFCSFNA